MTAAAGKEHLKKLLGTNQQIAKQNAQLQQQSTRLHNSLREMMEENVDLRQEVSSLKQKYNSLKEEDMRLREEIVSRAHSLEMIGSHLMDMSHLLAALLADDDQMEEDEEPIVAPTRLYKMVEVLEVTNKKQRKRSGLRDKTNLTTINEEN